MTNQWVEYFFYITMNNPRLIICLTLILFFEVVQFVTCVGFFDVDDIIMNGFSCLIGITFASLIIKKIRT